MTKTILYIEDNPRNLRLARKFLEFAGYEVLEAVNGLSGLEMAAAQNPDLILMDVNLPDIDGLEATGRLKSDDALKIIPVIALTANAMQGDRERCLAAGCDGYIPKPINKTDLLETVAHFVSQNPDSNGAAEPVKIAGSNGATEPVKAVESNEATEPVKAVESDEPTEPEVKASTILVIEDNVKNARLVTKILNRNGYKVHHAETGEGGFSTAIEESPDLILVDMGLPDMDGQTVVALLKQRPSLDGVPILAFTAWPQDTAKSMAIAYGCDGVISKPVDMAQLLEEVRGHLSAAKNR